MSELRWVPPEEITKSGNYWHSECGQEPLLTYVLCLGGQVWINARDIATKGDLFYGPLYPPPLPKTE